MSDRSDIRTQLETALAPGYSIGRELGGGGMSRVYLANETALDREVVVKVLPPELAHAVSAERFRQEIRHAARLSHPHIVQLLSAGQAGDLLYYTMPFVEGESLRTRLARSGELPIREAVRLLREVADALAYAHTHGLVYRDIKPDNVMLSSGHAVVTDFGVAKALSASATGGDGGLTSLGVALGTPAYLAPEQAAAEPTTDNGADLYAWGCLASIPLGYATVSQVLAKLETARAAERRGQRDRAVEDYRFVLNVWRHADPELRPHVDEARAALARLSGEGA